jgi:hypothetical protein
MSSIIINLNFNILPFIEINHLKIKNPVQKITQLIVFRNNLLVLKHQPNLI